ncbi:MAG TPA: hypothetical protein VIE65_06030 [Methylobacter sp.]
MKTFVLIAASLATLLPTQAFAQDQARSTGLKKESITFPLTVATGAKGCLPNAQGTVTDISLGPVESLTVVVQGLPPNTAFDLFNIEVPNAPFGLAWYLGDIETNTKGKGVGHFIGRFNIETFIISPGVPLLPDGKPPQVFSKPPAVVAEATVGIQTDPVQIYHLGLWFNSADDALKAGCTPTHTPFNGEHNAGIQVLNTATFPQNAGPLINLK